MTGAGFALGVLDGLVDDLSDGLADDLSDGLADDVSDGLADGLLDDVLVGLVDGLVEGRGDVVAEPLPDGAGDAVAVEECTDGEGDAAAPVGDVTGADGITGVGFDGPPAGTAERLAGGAAWPGLPPRLNRKINTTISSTNIAPTTRARLIQ